jgi:transposase
MPKKVHSANNIKMKAVKLRLEGHSTAYIMDLLGIKNRTQIHTWVRWYKAGETHRFEQPIGKQYTFNKGVGELSELEKLKLENKQLSLRLEIMGKYLKLERSGTEK